VDRRDADRRGSPVDRRDADQRGSSWLHRARIDGTRIGRGFSMDQSDTGSARILHWIDATKRRCPQISAIAGTWTGADLTSPESGIGALGVSAEDPRRSASVRWMQDPRRSASRLMDERFASIRVPSDGRRIRVDPRPVRRMRDSRRSASRPMSKGLRLREPVR
jgi:hypothetical protein